MEKTIKKIYKNILDKNPNICFAAETNEEIIGTIMNGN
jgi:hypothetical protein